MRLILGWFFFSLATNSLLGALEWSQPIKGLKLNVINILFSCIVTEILLLLGKNPDLSRAKLDQFYQMQKVQMNRKQQLWALWLTNTATRAHPCCHRALSGIKMDLICAGITPGEEKPSLSAALHTCGAAVLPAPLTDTAGAASASKRTKARSRRVGWG